MAGVQQPRVLSRPSWSSSSGAEAIALAHSANVHLDPWQELAVEVILAEGADGNWASFETAALVARQNGKGEIILVVELAGLFLLGERLMLHSAHEFKTAKEAYLRIKSVIEGAPHLIRLVKQFRQSNEDTSVELTSGARLRFMARSRQSGRGFSAGRLLVDEAQILSRASMGALMPTLSAQPNPQINYFGTVPALRDDAEHFTDVRNRGRAGDDRFLSWMEWSIGEVCTDLDDRAAWAAANPALGYRIDDRFVEKERASLAGADFARERLSIWPEGLGAAQWSLITEADWRACADVAGESGVWMDDPVTFGIEVTPDRSLAYIAAAGGHADGGTAVELVDVRPDAGWLLDRAIELNATHDPKGWMVDSRSAAGYLVGPMRDAGLLVTECSTAELVKATGGLYDDIVSHKVRHLDDAELSGAAAVVTRRRVGDSWLWDRRSGTPLVAVSLARYGHLMATHDPTLNVW